MVILERESVTTNLLLKFDERHTLRPTLSIERHPNVLDPAKLGEYPLEVLLRHKLAHLAHDNFALRRGLVCTLLLALRVRDRDGELVAWLELTAIELKGGLGGGLGPRM